MRSSIASIAPIAASRTAAVHCSASASPLSTGISSASSRVRAFAPARANAGRSRALSVKVAAQAEGLKIDLRGGSKCEEQLRWLDHGMRCGRYADVPKNRRLTYLCLECHQQLQLGCRSVFAPAGKKAFIAGVADDQVRPLTGPVHGTAYNSKAASSHG